MFHWAKRSRNEVGGVFEVEQQGDLLICTNATVLKQRVPTGYLEFNFDPEALMAWQEEHLEGAFAGNGMPYAHWGIWHSHAGAGVGWSSLDQELIDDHGTRGFLVNIVVNKQRALYCRVDTYCGASTLGKAVRVEVPSEYKRRHPLSPAVREVADKLFDQCVEYVEPAVRVVHEAPRQAGYHNNYFRGMVDAHDGYWRGHVHEAPLQRPRVEPTAPKCARCGLAYTACSKANHHRKKGDKHAFTNSSERGRAAAALKGKAVLSYSTIDKQGTVHFYDDGCV
jgi:hypothetical protein